MFYSSHSVLQSGSWVKLKIENDGIYRLSFEDLQSLGFTSLQDVAVFGSGGSMLPQTNNDFYYDDLPENAVLIYNNDLYFYAEGPHKWLYDTINREFVHHLNRYSKASYYFITDGAGIKKRITTENPLSRENAIDVNYFDAYQYHEAELVNLLKSGSEWYGEEFSEVTSIIFQFLFPAIKVNSALTLTTNVIARAANESSFSVLVNGLAVQELSMVPVNMYSTVQDYASANNFSSLVQVSGDTVNVQIIYNKPQSEQSAKGWLNYLRLNARCRLIFNGSQMKFRDVESVGPGNLAAFHLAGTGSGVLIWNVTDPVNVSNVPTVINGDMLSFIAKSDSLAEYIAFRPSSFLIPEIVGSVPNQDIHGMDIPDLVIVSHPDFMQSAELLAETRRNNDNLDVTVVTPEMVYNEFSSGSPDVTAIRNMMKMFYDRAGPSGSMHIYLLLFGDGSYDNLNESAVNTNYIITYQSENSLNPTESFVTDDYFGLLDNGETLTDGLLDIGIGRLPVKSATEAEGMVNKIIHYKDAVCFGNWRNKICFTADDGDDNTHMEQAEAMAEFIDTTCQNMNITKVFLDAYPQEDGPSGQRSVMAEQAIKNTIEQGTLIFNYTGHGSETGLTAEQIIDISDIASWKNINKLPLFMTATCEFSRFDNYLEVSGGELVILNPAGGSIALFTTTRLAYSSPNFILNKIFYKYIFNDSIHNQRIGDVLRLTKNDAGSTINKLNFTLLGDPSMKLALPELNVITDKINSRPVSAPQDTLNPSEKVTISGYIADRSGNLRQDFSGFIYPEVLDKPDIHYTIGTDGNPAMPFKLQDKILFKGKAGVVNGRFSFTFIAPRDMNPDIGYGKISYYADNTSDSATINKTDACGSFNKLLAGGSFSLSVDDDEGPEISIYLDNENFVFGGITGTNPVLIVILCDSSGINTAGTGIGHEITLIIDGNTSGTIILNDYYEACLNSYQNGRIDYNLQQMVEGSHNIRVKAWDVFNNPNEAYTELIVSESKELFIGSLFNYPNPFKSNTTFCFSHNLSNQPLNVSICIYTIAGKFVKNIEKQIVVEAGAPALISWDGRDVSGNNICRGLYLYKLYVKTEYGHPVEKTGKLIIMK